VGNPQLPLRRPRLPRTLNQPAPRGPPPSLSSSSMAIIVPCPSHRPGLRPPPARQMQALPSARPSTPRPFAHWRGQPSSCSVILVPVADSPLPSPHRPAGLREAGSGIPIMRDPARVGLSAPVGSTGPVGHRFLHAFGGPPCLVLAARGALSPHPADGKEFQLPPAQRGGDLMFLLHAHQRIPRKSLSPPPSPRPIERLTRKQNSGDFRRWPGVRPAVVFAEGLRGAVTPPDGTRRPIKHDRDRGEKP